jgi:hypothetical protein
MELIILPPSICEAAVETRLACISLSSGLTAFFPYPHEVGGIRCGKLESFPQNLGSFELVIVFQKLVKGM